MASGGMNCFDCHGDLGSVGGDHPLQAGGSLDGANDGMPRRPWQDLPRCQSCHTGDAASYLSTGTGLMRDGTWPFRLVQAYRADDGSASPVAAPGSRFAEK
jgi:mono/diheme cytochrome c family protein